MPECIIETDRIPAYNNDEGYVVLLNEDMEVIDEFHYYEKMHSPFLTNKKGVSLERNSFSSPTNDPDNWHSASTIAPYGTPGYKNSQINNNEIDMPKISFDPREFSPNGDGFNDELLINYKLEKSVKSAKDIVYWLLQCSRSQNYPSNPELAKNAQKMVNNLEKEIYTVKNRCIN